MKLNQFIAGCFGIVGFILSIVAGLHADNGFNTIVIRALLMAGGCYIIGYAVGVISNFIVQEHAQRIAAKVAEQDAAERNEKEKEPAGKTDKTAAGSPVGATAT